MLLSSRPWRPLVFVQAAPAERPAPAWATTRPARRHHRHRHLARAGVHQGVSRPSRVADQGRRRLQGRKPRLPGQREPDRRVRQDDSERVRRRDGRQHRRAARQGGRRPARERGRPAAPRAGDAGAEGAQAGVRRQAARRQPGGRAPDRGAGERDGHAAVHELLRHDSIPTSRRCGTSTRSARSSGCRPTIS